MKLKIIFKTLVIYSRMYFKNELNYLLKKENFKDSDDKNNDDNEMRI
jgi:hypothetical protein